MKRIDSDALGPLNRVLGVTGQGSQETLLEDDVVRQSLDVTSTVRRGRTLAGTQGLFRGVLQTNHAAANSQSAAFQPYSAPAGTIPPFPSPVPRWFDFWLLGASMRQRAGSGTVEALLELRSTRQGWGVDETGAAVADGGRIQLAFWDTLFNVGAGQTFAVMAGAHGPFVPLRLRVPREPNAGGDQVALVFTTKASAVSAYECQVFCALFPVALGQDGLD